MCVLLYHDCNVQRLHRARSSFIGTVSLYDKYLQQVRSSEGVSAPQAPQRPTAVWLAALAVALVPLHMRGQRRRGVVPAVADVALERFLIVMCLHVNLEMIAVM